MAMLAAEKEIEHIGETAGAADHDRDMIHDLGKRRSLCGATISIIANTKGDNELSTFWQSVKRQDEENIRKLKELIRKYVRADSSEPRDAVIRPMKKGVASATPFGF